MPSEPTPKRRRLSSVVQVRMAPTHLAYVDRAADRLGISHSELIRLWVERDMRQAADLLQEQGHSWTRTVTEAGGERVQPADARELIELVLEDVDVDASGLARELAEARYLDSPPEDGEAPWE